MQSLLCGDKGTNLKAAGLFLGAKSADKIRYTVYNLRSRIYCEVRMQTKC